MFLTKSIIVFHGLINPYFYMNPEKFFHKPKCPTQKQYDALRAFFYEKKAANVVADKFDYTLSSFYSLIRDFKKFLKESDNPTNRFFVEFLPGKRPKKQDDIVELIILLRKKYLSVSDIKAILDSQKKIVSETYIYKVLKREGFARLFRRSIETKQEIGSQVPIMAPTASLFSEKEFEQFNSPSIGILFFIPYIVEFGIDKLIKKSSYPCTKTIPILNSILSFLALKLSNIRRYTADDLWCMDRGLGLFAGLNVLPKAAWYTSYSHRITREMNIAFLKQLNELWTKNGLLSDTANLDFVTVPYWGEDSHLENNWSGTRHHALSSILAAISEDPDSGIITYGDTTIRHDGESDVVLEFLDFYKESGGKDLKYLVFDSKFTTYENLRKLDKKKIKFITIRRRGGNLVKELEALPKKAWKTVRVPCAGGKTRQLKVIDRKVFIKGYGKTIREIAITGHGKIKPAIIITNDFDLKLEDIIRKYARRWLVEKTISEQTHFFHLNKVSSSMVIKVDFDLTMTILAHNLYRLLARDLEGYKNHTSVKIYEKFISNDGQLQIDKGKITAIVKKKRHHPVLLSDMEKFQGHKVPWWNNTPFYIKAASNT
ncbi:MAG: transposase [Chlamydiae bacterium]|nr:transposase [Chlamydiota bacterium]